MPGLFIVLEGIDGCGKTTVANMLAEKLKKIGQEVVLTGEPTDSPIGTKIHDILKHKIPAPKNSLDLQKLYVEDRLEHITSIIEPALAQDKIVISQRHALSTFAYGMAFGISYANILKLHKDILQKHFIEPDATFLLDIPATTAMERITSRGKGIEYFEKEERLAKIRDAYLKLAKQRELGKIIIIDASVSSAAVVQQIWKMLNFE